MELIYQPVLLILNQLSFELHFFGQPPPQHSNRQANVSVVKKKDVCQGASGIIQVCDAVNLMVAILLLVIFGFPDINCGSDFY